MKNKNRILCFALTLVAVFFIFPGEKAAALGPQAGNCHWGDYTQTNTTYVSAAPGENNQDQINSAIAGAPAGSTVFLKKGLYLISKPIIIKSNITLDGDKEAVVQLKSHAGWKTLAYKGISILDPLIGAGGAGGANASHDVTIRCFTIDGNKRANESVAFFNCIRAVGGAHPWAADYRSCDGGGTGSFGGDRYHGNGYYTLIYLNGGSNFSIHDMTMTDALNDGFKFSHLTDVKFYNNYVSGMGHEGVFAMLSHGIEVYANDFRLQASDGVRGSDCYDYVIHDNEFQSLNRKDSSAGIQIAVQHGNPVYNTQIYRNVFHDIWNGGIWLSTAVPMHGGQYPIFIHHNIFIGNGFSTNPAVGPTGGVISSGGSYSVIYNNVFDGNYGNGIYDKGGKAKIINNIIVGTKPGKYGAAGSGQAIVGGQASYNCLANPLFADQAGQDYHLKSMAGRWDPAQAKWVTDSVNSSCIDAGIPLGSDAVYGAYAKEPANNGARVNAGVYGNTTQASLTGNSPQNPMPPAPIEEDYLKGFSTSGSPTVVDDTISWAGYDFVLGFDGTNQTLIPVNASSDSPMQQIFPTPAAAPESATGSCMVKAGTAGLVPCGKNFDDPNTPNNECAACTLCSFALMIQLIIEFLLKLLGVAAVLSLVFGGASYVLAVGNTTLITSAKRMIEYTLVGFAIVLLAWLMVDCALSAFGYINPLGGSWHITCNANTATNNNTSVNTNTN